MESCLVGCFALFLLLATKPKMADDRFAGLPCTSRDVLQEFCDRDNFSEVSDIADLSDDDIADPSYELPPAPRISGDPQPAGSGDDSDKGEEDVPEEVPSTSGGRTRRAGAPHQLPATSLGTWVSSDSFDPLPPAPWYDPEDNGLQDASSTQNFNRYIPDTLLDDIAHATSANILASTGTTMPITSVEIKKFIGMTIKMSYLKLPRIRMYWAARTRVQSIADCMPRNKYFTIRNNLRVRDYAQVTQQEKRYKYWKVAPLLNAVREACLNNPRSQNVSIDEQMVPFWGSVLMRQRVKGKPNPVGLKKFVACCPDGLPLDFFLYEGKGDSIMPNEDLHYPNLDIAGKVIVRLSRTLLPGSSIYMDRFFNSVPLLDELHLLGFTGTGTLKKDRIPVTDALYTDAEMRRGGRGFMQQIVREDGQVAVIKWFDSKPVVLASSVNGANQKDKCKRWNKVERRYVDVDRPIVVKLYNDLMGGVDMFDRMMSYYRINARTKKWTVRLLFHMIDFVIAAGWLEKRRFEAAEQTPKRFATDMLQYKTDIADQLIESRPNMTISDDDEEEEGERAEEAGPASKRKKPNPLTSDARRLAGTLHLPELNPSSKNRHRCRFPGCSSTNARFFCTTCKVWLCITQDRNCYKAFHEV